MVKNCPHDFKKSGLAKGKNSRNKLKEDVKALTKEQLKSLKGKGC